MDGHDDFAFEPSPGIPAPLPAGEHVLWQGKPDFRTLTRSPFHVRATALWFVALTVLALVRVPFGDTTFAAALPGVAITLGLGAVAIGILALIAWLTARVTIYTITTRRVLIRFGIALQVTMNVPFAEVLGADVREGRDGIGDIPLQVVSTRRVGYAVLWPHVRPWRVSRPEPMLRAVPDVERVAGILVGAMHGSIDTPARPTAPANVSDAATLAVPARSGDVRDARSADARIDAVGGLTAGLS